MATIRFKITQAFGPEAMEARKRRMAQAMLDQVQRRLHNGGDEDGPLAPLDFPRIDGTTANPLLRTGANLANTLTHGTGPKTFFVGSRFIGARVHQYGTIGKGGLLPSIVPVRAKALFVPMSKYGAKSVLEGGERVYKTKSGKAKELRQHKDFRFLQKVDIRPRPYLRLTAADRRELVAVGFGGK